MGIAILPRFPPFSRRNHFGVFLNDGKTESPFVHILTALTTISSVCSSLFFDQKGNFSFFQQFGHASSVPEVLTIATTSILDTFLTKSVERRPKHTTEHLSRWSKQKLLGKDFRSSEKFPPHWIQTIDKSYYLTIKKDNWIPIIISERDDTHNLVSSDRVWQNTECARV